MENNTAIITLRIDPDLKKAFERMASEVDMTPSQLLRRYIRNVTQQHAEATAQKPLDLAPETQEPTEAARRPKKGQKMQAAFNRSLRK